MAVRATNNAWGVLSTAINEQTTSLTLQSGNSARFPVLLAGDWFYITVSDGTSMEIMKVTGTAGDQFTVVRGVDNTTAKQWAPGVRVQLNICAAAWDDLATDLAALPTVARTLATPITLTAPTAAMHAATRKYVTDNKMPKTTLMQAPIGFVPVKQWTANKVYMGWDGSQIQCQIDNTYMGYLWRTGNFDPNTKANAGAQLQWAAPIYETGMYDAYNGFGAVDVGSPWVIEGYTSYLRSVAPIQGLSFRLTWFKNQ